jgi:hypothetical protein
MTTSVSLNYQYIYNDTIRETLLVAETIGISIPQDNVDGRLVSAIKEKQYLTCLSSRLTDRNPEWDIHIPPNRSAYDIRINGIWINLKITTGKTSDNCCNKLSFFRSITGSENCPKSCNWNKWLENLKREGIRMTRNRLTEYHYLVVFKHTNKILFKSIFDLDTYIANPCNDIQINWGKELLHKDTYTADELYMDKVLSLIETIKIAQKKAIETRDKMASIDVSSLVRSQEE